MACGIHGQSASRRSAVKVKASRGHKGVPQIRKVKVQRLNMGAAGYAAQCLRQAQSEKHANLRDPFSNQNPPIKIMTIRNSGQVDWLGKRNSFGISDLVICLHGRHGVATPPQCGFPFQARRFLSPFQAASALMVSALSCRSQTQTLGPRHTRPVNLSRRIGASFCARVALRRKMPTRLWNIFAALTGILFTLTCGDKDTPWTMLRI